MRKFLIAAAFTVASLTANAAVAEEKQDLTPAQQAEGRMILETARNLINYGETKGDALALVTAAKMIAGMPGRVLADGQDGTAGANSANFDIETVLKKAEDLAQGDELITKVAADVRTAAEANSKAVCGWTPIACYWNGWCDYVYVCW
ncbi:MAG: hypothetical protein F9K19_20925 [Rhizobiaceae bacterium]|nr:MAG: hypothetical protein F9K19_20925 [Rhizobiaceae bacterium]CAG1014673.1 hypothetical protein RHIZO_04837 [Rhizobiaceae bacterium]